MQSPVKLRLYCSICARNDYYMDRIRAAADQLGLDYTLEKVTDDEELNRLDLTVPCLYAYCPGCRILNEQVLSDEPGGPLHPRAGDQWGASLLGRSRQRQALRDALSALLPET